MVVTGSLGPQCLKCRRRRVKCDSQKPQCHKCIAKGWTCPGYKKPLSWVMVSGLRGQQARSCKNSRTSPASDEFHTTSSSSTLTPPLHSTDDKRTWTVVESVHYFNDYIFPDIAALVKKDSIDPSNWLQAPCVRQDVLVVISLATKALKSGCRFHSDLYDYRGRAIRDLNSYLQGPWEELWPLLLVAVLFILQQEVVMATKGWEAHLNASRTIITMCGGIQTCLKTMPDLEGLLIGFTNIDIVSGTTSKADELSSARVKAQAKYLQSFPSAQKALLASYFPCPLEILEAIVSVNILRVTWLHDESPFQSTPTSVSRIFARMQAFSPTDWIDEIEPILLEYHDEVSREMKDEWATLSSCYKSSAMIYLIGSMGLYQSPFIKTDEERFARSMLEQALVQLRGDLNLLLSPFLKGDCEDGGSRLWKFVVWPLLIYGYARTLQYDTSNTQQQGTMDLANDMHTFYGTLRRLGTALASRALLDGADMLEELYRDRSAMSDWSWGDGFPHRCVFVI